jgi:Fe-S-cluster containining protein
MAKVERDARKRWKAAVTSRASTVLRTGLSKRPEPVDTAAAAEAIAAGNATPAQMASRAYDLCEQSTRQAAPKTPLACKQGCAWCCYGMVSVAAPEAFRLAAALRAKGETAIAGFRMRAAATENRTAEARFGAKLACPFLVDGACSVYATRPLACRGVTAFDVGPCLDEYEGKPGDIAMPDHHLAHATNAKVALVLACAVQGRAPPHYELGAAVSRVLDTPDAERRWGAGEDIFAGVLQDTDATQVIDGLIGRIPSGAAQD